MMCELRLVAPRAVRPTVECLEGARIFRPKSDRDFNLKANASCANKLVILHVIAPKQTSYLEGGKPPGIRVNHIDFAEHMVDEYLPDEASSAHLELAALGSHDDALRAEFTKSSDPGVPGLLNDDDSDSDESLEDSRQISARWLKFLAKHYASDQLGDARANTYTWLLELSRDLGLPGDDYGQYPWTELWFSLDRVSVYLALYHIYT
ncbi:hypothetical protein PTI98_010847 [Pleurotus ostreatus]|nr:hypothetical protein PTI98_010847 [Pleurotus ostreatus]